MEYLNFLFNKRKGKISVVEKGLSEGLKREQSLKAFFIALLITVFIAVKFEKKTPLRMILIGLILLCFIFELINTSIEAVVDRISTKNHFLSGYAKDLASTATFLFTLFTLIVWGYWVKNQWILYNKNPLDKNIFRDWRKILLYVGIAIFFLVPITQYLLNMLKSIAIIRNK